MQRHSSKDRLVVNYLTVNHKHRSEERWVPFQSKDLQIVQRAKIFWEIVSELFRKNRILIKVHCCSFLMEDTVRINSKLQERSKTWHADPIAVAVVVTCCSLDQEWSLALHGVTWWVLFRYVSSQSEKAAPLRHRLMCLVYLIHVLVWFPGWTPWEKKLIYNVVYNVFSDSWVDIYIYIYMYYTYANVFVCFR